MKNRFIILWFAFIFSLQVFAAHEQPTPDIASHLEFKKSSKQFVAHGQNLMVYMYQNQYIQTLFDHQEQGIESKGKWWILDVEEKNSRKVLLRMRIAPVDNVLAKFPTELIGVYRYNNQLNGPFIMDLADQILKKFNLESYLYDDSRVDIELNIDDESVAFPIFLRLFRKLVKGKTWYEEQGYSLCDIENAVICPRYKMRKTFEETPRFRLTQNSDEYQKALNTIKNSSLVDLKILLQEDGDALSNMIQAVSDKSVKNLGDLFVALQSNSKKLNKDHLSPAYLYHLAFQKIFPWQGEQEEADTWRFTDPWSDQKTNELWPYFKKTYPRDQFVVSDDDDDDVYKQLYYSWKKLFTAVHTIGHSIAFKKPFPFHEKIKKSSVEKSKTNKKKRPIKLIEDHSTEEILSLPAKKRQKRESYEEICSDTYPMIDAIIRGDTDWIKENVNRKELVNQAAGSHGPPVFVSNYIANLFGSYRMRLWELGLLKTKNGDTLNNLVSKYEAITNLLLPKSKSKFKNMAYQATYVPNQNIGLTYSGNLIERYFIEHFELDQMIEN